MKSDGGGGETVRGEEGLGQREGANQGIERDICSVTNFKRA